MAQTYDSRIHGLMAELEELDKEGIRKVRNEDETSTSSIIQNLGACAVGSISSLSRCESRMWPL